MEEVKNNLHHQFSPFPSTVLAVGHDDGTVTLREVENAKVLHKFSIGVEITYLSWTACPFK